MQPDNLACHLRFFPQGHTSFPFAQYGNLKQTSTSTMTPLIGMKEMVLQVRQPSSLACPCLNSHQRRGRSTCMLYLLLFGTKNSPFLFQQQMSLHILGSGIHNNKDCFYVIWNAHRRHLCAAKGARLASKHNVMVDHACLTDMIEVPMNTNDK